MHLIAFFYTMSHDVMAGVLFCADHRLLEEMILTSFIWCIFSCET